MATVHMRLKATFTIELEASDFVEAARHQCALEEKLAALRETFPHSQLKIVNGRERKADPAPARVINRNITGRLHAYTG
jgi:hypothetical protein